MHTFRARARTHINLCIMDRHRSRLLPKSRQCLCVHLTNICVNICHLDPHTHTSFLLIRRWSGHRASNKRIKESGIGETLGCSRCRATAANYKRLSNSCAKAHSAKWDAVNRILTTHYTHTHTQVANAKHYYHIHRWNITACSCIHILWVENGGQKRRQILHVRLNEVDGDGCASLNSALFGTRSLRPLENGAAAINLNDWVRRWACS